MKAILVIGVPGSGKSTWAEESAAATGARIVELDRARAVVNGDSSVQGNIAEVVSLRDAWLQEAAASEQGVIVSDTNLHPQFRDELVAKLGGLGFEVSFKVFWTDHEISRQRNRGRANPVPEDVMTRFITAFEEQRELLLALEEGSR